MYKAGGVAGLSATLLGAVILLSPSEAGASWPFAHAAAANSPILHDPSTGLLEAAINSDPNPSKDESTLTLSDGSALMANTGPDGDLPDDSSNSSASSATLGNKANSTGNISVYTVKNGDSISGIADHFGVSVNTILWANDLTITSTIKPGMSLVILPVSGVKHTVAKGETLSSIAASFHADGSEIATFNGLNTNATVVVGSTLIIPHGEATGGATTRAVASTRTTTTKTTTTKTPASTTTTKTTTTAVKTGSDIATAVAAVGSYFSNPVPGALLTQGIHGNNGVDLGAPSGTPIHAAAAGTVIVSKNDAAWNGGYGSYVVISHLNGTQTLYAHMSSDIANVGETVSKGEVIGYVGETGEATGNHLHFEVRGGKNPFGYTCTVMKKCY